MPKEQFLRDTSRSVWLGLWMIGVAIAWLLPNHFPPWASFHSDAWMAAVTLAAAFYVISKGKGAFPLHGISSLVLVLALVPWLQYSAGMLTFASQAWLSSSYLLGLAIALVIGAKWEQMTPLQAIDGLAGAILIAAILSVGLALGSWMGVIDVDVDTYLSMGYSGGRQYANMGQPNLLASLLLWGLVSCLWGSTRNAIGAKTALFACAFLVLGLTMTRSRMAYVAAATLVVLVWGFRGKWRSSYLPWAATALFGLYLLFPVLLKQIDTHILMDDQYGNYVRSISNGDIRLGAWKLFLYAALDKPWFGYGWTEVVSAQIHVGPAFSSLGGMFGQTHNILLDLIIWLGIPVGSGIILFMLSWLYTSLKNISSQEDVVLIMFVFVVGVHSMFEYPLQYAYFLIPTGIIVGVMNARLHQKVLVYAKKWCVLGLWGGCSAILLCVTHDYLNIQASYNVLRFNSARIRYPFEGHSKVPSVYLLTQFRYWFEMAYSRPKEGMSEVELQHREEVTRAYPSTGALFELAVAYGKNNQPQAARYWLARICSLSNDQECGYLKSAWKSEQSSNEILRAISWP